MLNYQLMYSIPGLNIEYLPVPFSVLVDLFYSLRPELNSKE